MNEYSSVQIANFLKGSKLHRRMNDIGVLAGKSAVALENGDIDDDDDDVVGSDTGNDGAGRNNVSMEVLFGEPDDEENSATLPNGQEIDGGGGFLSSSTDNPGSSRPKANRHENESEEVISLQDSAIYGASNNGLGNNSIDLDRSIHKNGDHVNKTLNESTARGIQDSQPFQLVELASAGDQWAAWGNDTDSDHVTSEQPSPKNTDSSQLNNTALPIDDDSSSDDEGMTTFLTLASTNNHNPVVKPAVDELKSTAESSDESKSVDWEDGDSDVEVPHVHGRINNSPLNNTEAVNNPSESIESSGVAITLGLPASNASVNAETTSSNKSYLNIDVGTSSRAEEETEMPLDDEINLEEGSTDGNNHDIDRQQVAQENVVDTTTNDIPLPLDQKDTNDDIITSDRDILMNEFDIQQHQNPNIAALQHAQETASKLTDWAGRAVQRAIASHLEQHTNNGSPQKDAHANNGSPQKDAQVDEVDLTRSETEADSPRDSSTEKAPHASSESNDNQRQVEFLDTSLEGLNAAHTAILDEEKQMERDMSTITDEMKEDILKLLQLCGIPWIDSPAEAEAQCAALEELGLVDGVVTEDSDIFVFGGKKVYKVS